MKRNLPDPAVLKRLGAMIEEILPRDFSSWEEEHSRWQGDAKTFDGTKLDPRSKAGAFAIYHAFELGEELYGFADEKKRIGLRLPN